MPSRIQSIAASPEVSPSSSRNPSCAPGPSLVPLPPFEGLSISPRRSPIELNDSESGSEHGNDAPGPEHQQDGQSDVNVPELERGGDDDTHDSEEEEEEIDDFHDAGGAQPKAAEKVRGWEELREQIKKDLGTHQRRPHATHTKVNQLLVLRNFATLRIKGFGRIAASQQIAAQWHEGVGAHFARQIQFLARHYQLFEQLPVEKRGGDRGRSLINDEKVQSAARTHLMGLSTGEVTPEEFQRALNENILPSLGYTLKGPLSRRTASRWLYKLGWRHKALRKGVYMDGHERPDVVTYQQNEFLPLMASYESRMVRWEPEGDDYAELVRKDPVLGPGEKRIIALFQDESSFHVNEYKKNIWCVP